MSFLFNFKIRIKRDLSLKSGSLKAKRKKNLKDGVGCVALLWKKIVLKYNQGKKGAEKLLIFHRF